MPDELFCEKLESFTEAGRFFAALTDRLRQAGDAQDLGADGDITRLAHRLLVPVPLQLAGASIALLNDTQLNPSADQASVVITFPPVTTTPPTEELGFKKCFTVCQTAGGAKICATVCVDISIGLSGAHGNLSATVSVGF